MTTPNKIFQISISQSLSNSFPIFQLTLEKLYSAKKRNLMVLFILILPIIGIGMAFLLSDTIFGRFTFLQYFTFFAYFYYNALVGVVILLFFSVSVTAEEFSNKTITYYLHSPINKVDIIVWKYLATIFFALSIFLPIITAFFVVFANFIDSTFIITYQDILFGAWIVTFLNIVLYTSVFFVISLLVPKYPMIWGLFISLVDLFLQGTFFEGLLGSYSISYHIRAVSADLLGYRSILQSFIPVMSIQDSYVVIIIYSILFFILSTYLFVRKEVT